VIATDAVISVVISMIKISVFGLAGAVTAQVLAFALLIGGIALPGAFLARAFVERMPVHIHAAILDVVVIVGGVVMISTAVRQCCDPSILLPSSRPASTAWCRMSPLKPERHLICQAASPRC
jgi:hypothetical protein